MNCETFQVFTQNQRQWASKQPDIKQVTEFSALRKNFGYANSAIVAHASYLINLCAADTVKLEKSRKAFSDELVRCDALGIDYLVVHPGSHGGNGEEWGIEMIAESLNSILSSRQPKVKILLESIAGQGTGIGYNFEQLSAILVKTRFKNHLGICLDTCHLFAAGYEIYSSEGWSRCIGQMDDSFGSEKVYCIHLNDSKYPLGSRKDRHAAIGEGFIGLDCFHTLMNHPVFDKTPGILEVPGGQQVFLENLMLLKSFRDSQRL